MEMPHSHSMNRRTKLSARIRLLVAATLSLCATAAAQQVVPFAGWTTESDARYEGILLEKLAGDLSPYLREYGFFSGHRRVYAHDGKTATLTMYEFRDPSAAYGAFTFLRTPDMEALQLPDPAAASASRAIALKGDLVLTLDVEDAAAWTTELAALLKNAESIADQGPYPSLPGYFPAEGRVPLSERYVLGRLALSRFLPPQRDDWLGFEAGAEVGLARYRAGGKELTLVLAMFPTPQGALGRLKTLEATWSVNPEIAAKDGRRTVYARRINSLLAVIPDAPSRADAETLLARIRYETNLTWNEPTFKATEIPFSQMLVGIFVGTMWILLYAVLSGLLFGGIRVLVQRMLPGKVFDRPESVEFIRLDLTTKPPVSRKIEHSKWS